MGSNISVTLYCHNCPKCHNFPFDVFKVITKIKMEGPDTELCYVI